VSHFPITRPHINEDKLLEERQTVTTDYGFTCCYSHCLQDNKIELLSVSRSGSSSCSDYLWIFMFYSCGMLENLNQLQCSVRGYVAGQGICSQVLLSGFQHQDRGCAGPKRFL